MIAVEYHTYGNQSLWHRLDFAGMLFASEFRIAESPSAALGANMLGAVAGGLLENLSLLFGMRALLLVAMGLYCLAGIGLLLRLVPSGETPRLSEKTGAQGEIRL